MFNWFTFTKSEEDIQQDKRKHRKKPGKIVEEKIEVGEKIEEYEDIYIIPTPPPVNKDLAMEIKNNKTKYRYLYFCNSAILFRDLASEYNYRLMQREDKENMRGLLPFLFNDLYLYFHKRQMKLVLKEFMEVVEHKNAKAIHKEKMSVICNGELVRESIRRILNYRAREINKIIRLPLPVEIMLEYERRIINRMIIKRKLEDELYEDVCKGSFLRGINLLQERLEQYEFEQNVPNVENVEDDEREFIDVYVEKYCGMEPKPKKLSFDQFDWDEKLKEWGIEQNPSFINPFYLDDVTNLRIEREIREIEDLFSNENEEYENHEEYENEGEIEENEKEENQKLLETDSDTEDNSLDEIVIHDPGKFMDRKEITEEDMFRISLEIENDMKLNDDKEIKSKDKDMLPKAQNERKTIHPKEGRLELYIGPMYSGKSSKIVFKLTSMADQRFKCLYINSKKDNRETESIDLFVSTHNSSYSRISNKIDCVKADNLNDIDVSEYDYIAIDEFQFFNDVSVLDTIIDWVTVEGKCVFIASLDGDAYRRKFGYVLDLIPKADYVEKLTAYCDNCRDNYKRLIPAPFTARMTSDKTAELVGGKNIYRAMCRTCHDFHLDIVVNNI